MRFITYCARLVVSKREPKLIARLSFFLSLSLFSLATAGCAGKFADVEELSNGNHLLKVSIWAPNDASDEPARAKAKQEADKICRHDGRAMIVENLTTAPDRVTGWINAEIEFNCAPKSYPDHRK
jgi:hypothetical protein